MTGGPLSYQPFRWLLAARTTNILGNVVAPIALAFAVLDLTGSVIDLGLVVAARSLANVAVLLFGGVIADRMPRHHLLVGTSVAAGITQGVVALLVISATANIPVLVVLSVLNGALAALSFPAAAALVPQTVPESLLRPANALLRLSLNAGTVLGASLGALVVAVVGPGYGLAIDAAGFVLSGFFFLRVRPQTTVVAAQNKTPLSVRGIFCELREGWHEFSSRRWLWVVVVQFAVLNAAFVGVTVILGPLIADTHFGRAGWGVVIAAQSLGYVLGGLLALRWKPRHALAIGVGLAATTAIPSVLLATFPLIPLLFLGFLAAGLALEQFGVAWDHSLQQHIPADRLARVYSYDAVGSFCAVPLGELVVGPLSQIFGITATLIASACVIVLASIAALSVRSVRQLHVGSSVNSAR